MARSHARLVWQRDRWHLQDDGSKNGCFVDGQRNLLADFAFKDVVAAAHISARIDDRKFAPVPLGKPVMTVARHAALLIHDGLPAFRKPVKKGGFSNIRTADDGDNT